MTETLNHSVDWDKVDWDKVDSLMMGEKKSVCIEEEGAKVVLYNARALNFDRKTGMMSLFGESSDGLGIEKEVPLNQVTLLEIAGDTAAEIADIVPLELLFTQGIEARVVV